MTKKVIFGGLIGLAILAGTITTAKAGQKWGGKNLSEEEKTEMKTEMDERRAEMEQKRAEMQDIFANNDYDAWESLMQEKASEMQKRVDEFSAQINNETFKKLNEIHRLVADGKYEEARELREKLGEMGLGMDCGRGMGKGGGLGRGFGRGFLSKPTSE